MRSLFIELFTFSESHPPWTNDTQASIVNTNKMAREITVYLYLIIGKEIVAQLRIYGDGGIGNKLRVLACENAPLNIPILEFLCRFLSLITCSGTVVGLN